MPNFSDSTAGVLAQLLDRDLTHSELGNLFLRLGLPEPTVIGAGQPTKLKRATDALTGAVRRGEHEKVKAVIEDLMSERRVDERDKLLDGLDVALRGDGWKLEVVDFERPDRLPWDTTAHQRYQLGLVGDGVTPLADEATAIERLLIRKGLTTAAGHYRQAVDALSERRWASANGQTRAAFESVLVDIARLLDPSSTVTKGGGAINEIDHAGQFGKGERSYLEGLWALGHSNGPHPGLSDEDEATNRLSAVTAAIRYVIGRLL